MTEGTGAGANGRVKVLLLLHELSLTGAPKLTIEAFHLLRDQLETQIIAMEPGPMLTRTQELGPVYRAYLPPLSNLRDIPIYLRQKLAQKTWAGRWERWRPDIIYANSVASLPLIHRFNLPKVPVLLHVMELETLIGWYERGDPRALREWPDRYIAITETVRTALVERYEIPDEKIAVVYGYVDEKHLENVAERAAAAPANKDKRFVVGGSGRIQWRKGFELWLQTAAIMRERLGADGVRFVWVGGEGDILEEQFRTTSRKLGVEDVVEIVPMTPDPLPHYLRFDAFAMTSWEEPFGVVTLEAMALGKPAVCIAGSGGPPEQLGDAGIVVSRFDARELADALMRLQENPELRAEMGRRARERALSNYTAAIQVPKIEREILRLARRTESSDALPAPTDYARTAK